LNNEEYLLTKFDPDRENEPYVVVKIASREDGVNFGVALHLFFRVVKFQGW